MDQLPKTETIICERHKAWLTIWLNTPENRNALSAQMNAEFKSILDHIKEDRSIRGITLRGKGGVFCAGGDLKGFFQTQTTDNPYDSFKKLNRLAGDLFDQLLNMPQVVIAYVQGAAIAGGLGLMCCADIIIVEESAKFSLTETMIGLPPAQIAPLIVARTGLPIARKIMLTGTKFTGLETKEYNLSDYVVAHEADFEMILNQIQDDVYKCAPGAIGITKDILLATPYLNREEQKDFAATKFADAITSAEGHEGIASFIQKRQPNWAKNVS